MTEKQIKARRGKLDGDIRKKTLIHSKAYAKLKKAEDALNLTLTKLYELREKCKHQFPNKPPTFMGRGVCDICGENDY